MCVVYFIGPRRRLPRDWACPDGAKSTKFLFQLVGAQLRGESARARDRCLSGNAGKTPVTLFLQDDLQAQITGALGQLSRASALLTTHTDPAATAQLDDLLDEVIRQQNEISDKHSAWADATGADASRTMNLGITGAVTRQATQRCAFLPRCSIGCRCGCS